MKPVESMLWTAALLLGAVLLGVAASVLFYAGQPAWGLSMGLAGFVAGLAFAVFWRGEDMSASGVLGFSLGVVVTAVAGVVATTALGAARAVVLLALSGGAAAAGLAAIRRITETGEAVGIESEWGGLGQGLGGWRLTPAAALLLLAIALGALAFVVATTGGASGNATLEKDRTPVRGGGIIRVRDVLPPVR